MSSDSDVAKRLGIARQTISEWRSQPQFVAELNRAKNKQAKELTAVYSKNTKSLVNAALIVIGKALAKEDAQSARWLLDAVRFSEWGQSVFQKVVNPVLQPEDTSAVIDEMAAKRVDEFLASKGVGPLERLRLREALTAKEAEALRAESDDEKG